MLVGAIYTLQRCETIEELDAAKVWLRDYIDTCDELNGGTLRNLVQTFFQLKIDIVERWVRAFRMGKPHFNIISSSRIEGEFSWLWYLRLTSASTLCKSIMKIRWAASRRHHKKQKSIEDWMSTTLKKTNPPHILAENWAWLDKVMTPHHFKKIVHNITDARNYHFQLTKLSEDAIEFTVWRTNYDQEPSDAADLPGVESGEEEEDAEDSSSGSSDEEGAEPEPVEVQGRFFFEGRASTLEETSSARTQPANVRMEPFLYRHIRKVVLTKCGSHYVVTCTCANCEAACIPCTHMFLIIEYVAPILKMSELNWHRRTKKSYYSKALFEVESGVCLRDLVHSDSALPKIASATIELWLQKNTDAPLTEGIPCEGLVNPHDFNDGDGDDGGGGEAATARASARRGLGPRRKSAPDKAAADTLYWNITECLGKQHPIYKDFCDILTDFRNDLERRGIEHAGPGKRDRIRGFWEPPKGSSKRAKVATAPATAAAPVSKKQKSAAPDDTALSAQQVPPRTPGTAADNDTSDEGGGEDGYEGVSGEAARNHLLEHGPSKGDILEIYPDLKDKRAGHRWFMIVKKPDVVQVLGKPAIESCRWCATNSLLPCKKFTDPTPCHIKNVKAWGLQSATLFKACAPAADTAPTRTVIMDSIKRYEVVSQPWLEHAESCTCRMCSGLPSYKQQGKKDQ